MRVFVSYRRSDSKDFAARLADNLRQLREIDNVFFDVESIAYGEDFPDRLEREITRAQVVVAVIGPGWRGSLADGGEDRIMTDGDFVRAEIARALDRGKRIIPVLFDDAPMPAPANLPADIAGLAERNALAFRHTSFRQDFALLAEAVLGRKPAGPLSPARIAAGAAWRALAGFLVAALLALVLALASVGSLGTPLETTVGGRVPLAILLVLLFGAFQYWTYRYLKRNLD